MNRRALITACAPIPSDDLTADQIAGPYLEADIYARLLAQTGSPAHYVIASDDFHTQVDVRARELGCDPEGVIDQARRAIRRSLQAYVIEPQLFARSDAACQAFARTFFARLFAEGLLEVRTVDVLRDIKSGAYPTDAWVRGSCPSCLDATAGGSCEACAAPNGSVDLLGLDPQRYSLLARPRLILDLERFRPELERNLTTMHSHRPALARLIRTQLEQPLAPFVLSSEGGRGLSLDFAGLPEQRLHAAAASYVAQMYCLEKAAGQLRGSDAYCQFFEFGNAYTQTFVHGALACAAARCGLDWPQPSALFSSQLQWLRPGRAARSLIWARELTDVYGADALRIYLALTGPEHAEAHFVRRAMESSIEHIAASIDQLVQIWNQQRYQSDANLAPLPPRDVIQCMQRSAAPGDCTIAELARRALNCLDHFAHKASQTRARLTRFIPSLLALSLEPFCPSYTRAVRDRFPEAATSWSALTPSPVTCDLPRFEAKLNAHTPTLAATSILADTPSEMI